MYTCMVCIDRAATSRGYLMLTPRIIMISQYLCIQTGVCKHAVTISSTPSELSDTGRMLTALSDGYLTMHDESHAHPDFSPHHHHQLSMSLDGRHFILSPDETLFPPLTHNDRHPSAPQLVSMLTDSKADVMLHEDQVLYYIATT